MTEEDALAARPDRGSWVVVRCGKPEDGWHPANVWYSDDEHAARFSWRLFARLRDGGKVKGVALVSPAREVVAFSVKQ